LWVGAPALVVAQQTTIAGRVTESSTNQPLGDARVIIVGTSVVSTTNIDGRYTLRNAPTGTAEVRVIRVGYQEQKKSVQVVAGQTATIDFAMISAIVQLQEVVTTATGEQRRVELGNAIANLDASKLIADAPVANMGDLLVAKAPGVQILPGNMTGGGSRIRVRGTASLSLSNDPIFIIDGIRMTSDGSSAALSVGGTQPSRVSDINPEEIENIEIVKGPSAATLYGTAAANGVVVITTKRGRAGAPQWNLGVEQGKVQDKNNYPAQYAILGKTPGSTTQRKCLLKELSAAASATGATCLVDSATSLSIFDDADLSPLKDGWRNNYTGQLNGGTEAVRYFTSGAFENETGPVALTPFSQRQLQTSGMPIRGEWNRPEALQKTSVRMNLSTSVSPTLDLSLQSGFIKVDQRLPQVDNNVNSFWYNAETGPGYKKAAGPGYTNIGSLGQTLNGWAGFTPAEIFQETTTQGAQRFIGSGNANWRPFSWFSGRADLGLDLTDRVETQLCRFGQCADFGTNRQGFAADARANIRNFTTNVSGTGTWQSRSWLIFKTTGGAQYINYEQTRETSTGSILPPGAQTPASGTTPSISTAVTLSKTLGLFAEEAASVRDRLFFTVGVRTDQNSAFGSNFQRVYYPKASVSWLASDESFFPKWSWLNQVRLRGSVGASGVQPGQTDALRTFQTAITNLNGVDISGERSNLLGNANLKPERSTEWEGGFDIRFWQSRLNLEATYYSKVSKDALIDRTLAPDAGAAVTTVKQNLGAVKNAGAEFQLTGQVLDRRMLGWDATISYSHNSNKLVTLGKDGDSEIPPIINTSTRQIAGYPVNGYWQRGWSWKDADGDGYIIPSEVTVNTTGGPLGDGYEFIGYSQPRDELSIQNGFDLFKRALRISALFDYKGGSALLNNERSFLCQQTTSCPETSMPGTPTWQQARAVAERDTPALTQYGYFENLQFWRFRELTATYTLPEGLAGKYLKSHGASLSLGARNLHVWTAWTAADPEQNYSQGDTQSTLLTAGPARYFTARLNLRY
jgi:TonB-linked SusC/RagA family outer membrane protein